MVVYICLKVSFKRKNIKLGAFIPFHSLKYLDFPPLHYIYNFQIIFSSQCFFLNIQNFLLKFKIYNFLYVIYKIYSLIFLYTQLIFFVWNLCNSCFFSENKLFFFHIQRSRFFKMNHTRTHMSQLTGISYL